MKRFAPIALVAVLALVAPTTAFADLTMKSTVVNKAAGGTNTVNSTTFIKGNKMRTDMTGTMTLSTIMDMDAMKMYSIDPKAKEVTVYDMAKMSADIGKNVQISDMKASVKANGKTKQVSGKAANGYDMEVSVPAQMGGAKGMKMTVSLAGPVWVVKGGPGTAEYMAFYKNSAEKGFFGDPRSSAMAGQAKAMAEMYRQLAATGGIPYEMEMNVKMSGEGPMAAAFEKMGNISVLTTVTSVETGTLAAEMFAAPAGYKVKER